MIWCNFCLCFFIFPALNESFILVILFFDFFFLKKSSKRYCENESLGLAWDSVEVCNTFFLDEKDMVKIGKD